MKKLAIIILLFSATSVCFAQENKTVQTRKAENKTEIDTKKNDPNKSASEQNLEINPTSEVKISNQVKRDKEHNSNKLASEQDLEQDLEQNSTPEVESYNQVKPDVKPDKNPNHKKLASEQNIN